MPDKSANRFEAFDSDGVKALLKWKWNCYARWLFLYEAAMHVLLLALVSFVTPLSPTTLGVVLWLVGRMAVRELVQMKAANGALAYFKDVWNVIDVCIVFILGITSSYALVQPNNPQLSWLMPISTMLLWLKLFYFMQPFKVMGGPYIRSIIEITKDTLSILLILLVLVLAFGLTMRQLAVAPPEMDTKFWDYVDIPNSMWTVFRMLLGGTWARCIIVNTYWWCLQILMSSRFGSFVAAGPCSFCLPYLWFSWSSSS